MFVLNRGKYSGDVLNQLNVDGSIITTTNYSAKNEKENWHYHKNAHVSFVFEGIGESKTIKQSLGKSIENIYFYPAGEKHRWISHSSITKSANIEINNEFFHKYDLTETSVNESLSKNLNAKLLMLQIQQEMLMNDNDSFISIQTLLLELFTYTNPKENFTPNWVNILETLLNDKWNERITLPELAKIADVHPVTISKYFRRYFNCTLGEYQRKLKITKSLSLIKNNELSLTDIAFICGFADQSHFIRNFRKFVGFSPREFRKL